MEKVWITPYIKEINIEEKILKDFVITQNKYNLLDVKGAIIWHEKFQMILITLKI